MDKYRYNKEIGFLDIDPEFVDIGIKYANKEGIDAIRLITLNQNCGKSYDIDFQLLGRQKFIHNLIIGNDFKIKNMNEGLGLSNMQSLAYLQLLPPIEIEWQKLDNLKKLVLGNDKNIRGISELKNLRELLVISLRQSSFQELTNLTKLEILDIGGACLEDLTGIDGMESLTSLSISYSHKLHDLSPISKLCNLKILHVEHCKSAIDFSFLKGNKTIEELIVDKIDNLDFVPAMSSLQKIWFYNCISGDLTPLVKCTNIKDIYFYPKKKHYTHTLEQIQAMNMV